MPCKFRASKHNLASSVGMVNPSPARTDVIAVLKTSITSNSLPLVWISVLLLRPAVILNTVVVFPSCHPHEIVSRKDVHQSPCNVWDSRCERGVKQHSFQSQGAMHPATICDHIDKPRIINLCFYCIVPMNIIVYRISSINIPGVLLISHLKSKCFIFK